jgi:HAD superfamily hydrolase (TIGR01490 family)
VTSNTIAAFFDLDGTLYTGHIWKAITRHHWIHRKKLPFLLAFLVTNLGPWPLVKRGLLLDRERYFIRWGENMAGMVGGFSRQEAQGLFQWISEHDVAHSLYREAMSTLRCHQEQGHQVVLVSGTFQELLEVIAQGLEIPHAVGTPLEVRGERYTGRIVPPFCFGPYKVQRAKEFLETAGWEIDFASSFAYADTIYDVPLLESVGHPVAVCPDEELLAHARRRGWAVMGVPKGY